VEEGAEVIWYDSITDEFVTITERNLLLDEESNSRFTMSIDLHHYVSNVESLLKRKIGEVHFICSITHPHPSYQ
jgi:hypothetical protein